MSDEQVGGLDALFSLLELVDGAGLVFDLGDQEHIDEGLVKCVKV